MQPVAELPPLAQRGGSPGSPDTGPKVEALPRYSYPQIGIDGKGRVWLTYREKFGNRYTTHPGSYWLTKARRLDGDKWSEPIEVHHSDGLLDDRPVLLPHPAGGLRIIHNTDGRYTTPDVIDNQIYMSYLDLPGEPVEPKLMEHKAVKKDAKLVEQQKAEDAAVKRIREYRIETGGKKYQLLRGEFHRHTEISWDGGPDGSLEDMWRYAIDVAAMDWIGNGDHDNGAGREYPWWLTQKTTDAYHVAGRFTPMFTSNAAWPTRTAIATSCSPSAACAPCRAWPSRSWPGASAASTRTTRRCCTATCTNWAASVRCIPARRSRRCASRSDRSTPGSRGGSPCPAPG